MQAHAHQISTTIRMGAGIFSLHSASSTGDATTMDLGLMSKGEREAIGRILCDLHGIRAGKTKRHRNRKRHRKGETNGRPQV